MNIVILCGKLQKKVEFNFIYDSKYVSIARGSLILKDKNVVDIYGYDDIADFLYRNEGEFIWIEGSIREDRVEVGGIVK